jgi:hypothetical protein
MSRRSNHPASLLLVGLSLAGCVGTVDSVHRVTGTAPATDSCEVLVREAGTNKLIARESVRGPFSIAYAVPGLVAPNVDIVASCDGRVVRQLASISPRTTAEVQLGSIAP